MLLYMYVLVSKSVHASLPLGLVCESLKYLLSIILILLALSPLDGWYGSWEEDLCY